MGNLQGFCWGFCWGLYGDYARLSRDITPIMKKMTWKYYGEVLGFRLGTAPLTNSWIISII